MIPVTRKKAPTEGEEDPARDPEWPRARLNWPRRRRAVRELIWQGRHGHIGGAGTAMGVTLDGGRANTGKCTSGVA